MISVKGDNDKRLVVGLLAMAQNTSHLTLLFVGWYYKTDFH